MIKSIKESIIKRRRKFDETFKREAVQNWLNSGKSAALVGEELGLTATLLCAGANQ
jgi:transposase-like protein